MNRSEIISALKLSTEDLALFVERTTDGLSKDSRNSLFSLIGKLSFSNKHIFLEVSEEDRVKAILMSLLFSAVDPFAAQTIVMDAHTLLLKDVCKKLDISNNCLVPISTVEERILEVF